MDMREVGLPRHLPHMRFKGLGTTVPDQEAEWRQGPRGVTLNAAAMGHLRRPY